MKISRLLFPFRRLQWRLTFSYTLVTVAALVVAELLLFAALITFVNSNVLLTALVQTFKLSIAPQVRSYLESEPPDLEGLDQWLDTTFAPADSETQQGGLSVSRGLRLSFESDQSILVLDSDRELLAAAQTGAADPTFELASIPELEELLASAWSGDEELEANYRSGANGRVVMAFPMVAGDGRPLGTLVVLTALPTFDLATLRPLLGVVIASLIPFTLAAGLIGALFGFLTARGLSRRLAALARTADAWSSGDFSAAVTDRSPDELGELARRLNRMAEQLQNLLQTRQELAALEERNRLARDLHDSVKQQLFAGSMQIGAARALLPANPAAAGEHLAEAEQLARQSQQELAALIQELHPAALDGNGLAEALRHFGQDWSRRSGIGVEIRVQGERALPLEVEQALFRVAQEALANVGRHSRAHSAEIHLAWEQDGVTLTIADDGVGMARANGDQAGHGLRSMSERVERLGGALAIDSRPGGGTRVVASIPSGETSAP
jgi:NarL family two-component system sensor histidine kinase LiaS